VLGIPVANRRESRKLGLLHTQKFRRRTRAKFSAGENKHVCGENPTPLPTLMGYEVSIIPFILSSKSGVAMAVCV